MHGCTVETHLMGTALSSSNSSELNERLEQVCAEQLNIPVWRDPEAFSNVSEDFSYSLLCKWFQTAVLPLDKLLYAELFKTEDKKRCTECSTFFVSKSNSVKYCPDCRKRITRRQAAERMRKRRAAVTQ